MSDEITNGEILRSISRLESKMEKIDSKVENFKYWAFGVITSVIIAIVLNAYY